MAIPQAIENQNEIKRKKPKHKEAAMDNQLRKSEQLEKPKNIDKPLITDRTRSVNNENFHHVHHAVTASKA